MRIRQDGLPVYGFGTAKTPESFRQACTRFIDVGALTRAEDVPAAPKPQVDADLIDLLGAAYKAARRDERGFARLSEVGKLAGNRSSFDVRSYGFSRLPELIESLPNFVTERRDGTTFVKRVH
jgi:hypothetical protein